MSKRQWIPTGTQFNAQSGDGKVYVLAVWMEQLWSERKTEHGVEGEWLDVSRHLKLLDGTEVTCQSRGHYTIQGRGVILTSEDPNAL